MRLIDADKLCEELRAASGMKEVEGLYGYGWDDAIDEAIKRTEKAPTAFDMEWVIFRIRNAARKMAEAKPPHIYYRAIGTAKAEKIIRYDSTPEDGVVKTTMRGGSGKEGQTE